MFGLKTGIQFLKRKVMISEEAPIVARMVSRYGVERLIRKVDADTYTVEGESLYTRGTTDGSMVDFEGGPFIETNVSAILYGIPENRNIQSLRFLDSERDHYALVEVKLKPKL